MIGLIYNSSGIIVQSIQASEHTVQLTAKAMNCEYVEYVLSEGETYDQDKIDAFDATHKVVNGKVEAI